MAKYLIKVQYNGQNYKGWQKQAYTNQPIKTIQETIENKIKILLRHDVILFAAGRTDASVHANGQYAHFETDRILETDKFLYSINSLLKGEQIAILAIQTVDDNFHARFSCKSKTYVYRIFHSHVPDIFLENTSWRVSKFDVEKANACANFLIGLHDFASFQDAQCQAKSSIRTIDECYFQTSTCHSNLILMTIKAQSFLQHQIRITIGTIQQIITQNEPAEKIKLILEQKNRQTAGPTAPGKGLFLEEVLYSAIH